MSSMGAPSEYFCTSSVKYPVDIRMPLSALSARTVSERPMTRIEFTKSPSGTRMPWMM